MNLRLLPLLLLLAACQPAVTSEPVVTPGDPRLRYTGRFDTRDPSGYTFAWTGSQIEGAFTGSRLQLELEQAPGRAGRDGAPYTAYYRLRLDGRDTVFAALLGRHTYTFDLGPGRHQFQLRRRSEAETGLTTFRGLALAPGDSLVALSPPPGRRIVFYGNSITCGYGNLGPDRDCPFSPATEDGSQAYAGLAAEALGASWVAICYSGRGVWQNYDRSREGTLPSLHDRITPAHPAGSWDPARDQADAVVVFLGTNDFAHENPPEADFVAAYAGFLAQLRAAYPAVPIVCLTGSMLDNTARRRPLATHQRYLEAVLAQRQAAGDRAVYRLDLSLQGALGYGCDWHPSLAQHQVHAAELVQFFREKWGW